MSMIGQFIGVTAKELDDYLSDSALLEARLDAALDAADPAFFDVDKAWDTISYLLTGYSQQQLINAHPPLSWTIFGDKTIDSEQDLGYGPAWYLTCDQVKEVNNALINIFVKDIKINYDAQKMNELNIYPGHWDNSEDSKNWADRFFEDLKAFYANAAKSELAIISYIS